VVKKSSKRFLRQRANAACSCSTELPKNDCPNAELAPLREAVGGLYMMVLKTRTLYEQMIHFLQQQVLERLGYATVSNGWWYERRQSNGGGVSAAYDRKKGRAFVQTSPR
jgi:hypothetical protein